MHRNLSPLKMFVQMAMEHKPAKRFDIVPKRNFDDWKQKTKPEVIATLGDWPQKVPLNPELIAEWEHDGLVKQRWFIDVGVGISASLVIARSKSMDLSKKNPAILCWHGHGYTGKEGVMGNDASDTIRAEIKQYNCNYGHQMACRGFVTYAIDWMGVGERNDNNKPHYFNHNGHRDWCNLYYLHATMLGMTSLSINLSHGKAATDFLCSFPFVDKENIGVMGLSGGGTMALWTALTDDRIKAAEIICYSDLWAYFGFRDLNYCGMQVAPGLFKLVDLPDLQGLLAPMPLLIDIGIQDTCFLVDTATACFNRVKNIYEAANAQDKLYLDIFPGEHSWSGNKSEEFFSKYLKK